MPNQFVTGVLLVASAAVLPAQQVRSRTPSELLAAPESVMVAGTVLRVTAELWLNLSDSPLSSPSPSIAPLRGILTIHAAAGSSLPSALRADSLWLLVGAEMVHQDTLTGEPQWPTRASQEIQWVARRTDSTLVYRVWRGPARLLQDSAAVLVIRLIDDRRPVGLLRAPPSRLPQVSQSSTPARALANWRWSRRGRY